MHEIKFYWKDGFFRSDMHSIPEDAVEITKEKWSELLGEQENGRTVVSGPDGFPVAEDLTLAEKKNNALDLLWRNYKAFQQTYVDAEDLTLAVVCASKGSEKGSAVQMWVMGLWAQYYTVKDAIAAAQDEDELAAIDLTAESYGTPPYTIRELNEEAAAALETMSLKGE